MCGKGCFSPCYHLSSSRLTLDFPWTTSVHAGECSSLSNRAIAGLRASARAWVFLILSTVPLRCQQPSLLQAVWSQSHITYHFFSQKKWQVERRQNLFSSFFSHLTYISTNKSSTTFGKVISDNSNIKQINAYLVTTSSLLKPKVLCSTNTSSLLCQCKAPATSSCNTRESFSE